MLKLILRDLGPEIVVDDGISQVGIRVGYKPGYQFWIRYINKKNKIFDLSFEVKKISDGMKLDLYCDLSQWENKSSREMKKFTIHLEPESRHYEFSELED